MQPAKRVIKNTGFLYGKMFITILISLYSTRLILSALGEVDYGIFTLIGGVISMLSFINGAMIIATQRYLSISLGAEEEFRLKSVFNSSIVLHLIISLIIVIVLEIAGIFLFNGALNIPAERIPTAKIIYHLMIVSTFFSINAVPYYASINSHENMFVDALLGIFESVSKLGIAIWLIYSRVDKLILYGVLMAGLTIIIRIIISIYCHRKYAECTINFRKYVQKDLLKEMLAFAGWNVFGLFCSVLKSQGLAILLNVFFGVIVNAAYGIANQVNSNLNAFSTNMIRAVMPQITKSEGSGNRKRMLSLSMFASKMSFFLLAFFAIPIASEMHFVLSIWLKTVPENAVIFCQLILILSMLYQITVGTMASVTSVGDIKSFQIAVGAVEIFNLPFAFLLVKIGLPAYIVFVNSIFWELVAGSIRTWYAHKIAGLDLREFIVRTWLLSITTGIIAVILATMIRFVLHEGFIRAILVGITTSTTLVLLGKYLVLSEEENKKITEIVNPVLNNMKKKLLPG